MRIINRIRNNSWIYLYCNFKCILIIILQNAHIVWIFNIETKDNCFSLSLSLQTFPMIWCHRHPKCMSMSTRSMWCERKYRRTIWYRTKVRGRQLQIQFYCPLFSNEMKSILLVGTILAEPSQRGNLDDPFNCLNKFRITSNELIFPAIFGLASKIIFCLSLQRGQFRLTRCRTTWRNQCNANSHYV